jgi:hypothetical protein
MSATHLIDERLVPTLDHAIDDGPEVANGMDVGDRGYLSMRLTHGVDGKGSLSIPDL